MPEKLTKLRVVRTCTCENHLRLRLISPPGKAQWLYEGDIVFFEEEVSNIYGIYWKVFKPGKDYFYYIPHKNLEIIDNQWEIESVDRFYYLSSPNGKIYQEITFWHNSVTLERKEVVRSESIDHGHEYKLPDWCKSCEYRERLNYE